jgi:hypothetical protein
VLRPSIVTRRVALPLLAAAMLMLQALGLWHSVVHANGLATVVHAHDVHGEAGHHADDGFASHDDGDAQCRLYDQLAHADLMLGEAASFLCARADGVLQAAVPAGRLAPQAAGFLARGPPLTA